MSDDLAKRPYQKPAIRQYFGPCLAVKLHFSSVPYMGHIRLVDMFSECGHGISPANTSLNRRPTFEPESKVLESPFITPIILPYIIPYIHPFSSNPP